MALIVENGQGLTNAQTLASVAELRAFAAETGVALPSPERDCERLLIAAMRRMLAYSYLGQQLRRDQALPWPRAGIVIESWGYESHIIPKRVKDAQCAFAIAAQTIDLQPVVKANSKGTVVSETIGPISRTFADTGRILDAPRVPQAEALLQPFIRGAGAAQLIRA